MIFIFVLGVFGIVLINLFGNITTTNQQDYTTIKNSLEAAMGDAIDWASYRAGFYLCFNNEVIKTNDVYQFSSINDYEIVLNYNVDEDILKTKYIRCDFLLGEVKLNKDVFVESFIRRWANNINNNKNYQITIQEVIEYPPKVSVGIDTYGTYNGSESITLTGDYNIRNQFDAILEKKIRKGE